MGISDECIVNPAIVSDTLRCAICREVFKDPVCCRNSCQHVFCKVCITEALRMNATCPVCRSAMIELDLEPHVFSQSLLDELPVKCPEGCSWTGRQDAKHAHLEHCQVRLLAETRHKLNQVLEKLEAVTLQKEQQLQESLNCRNRITSLQIAVAERERGIADLREKLAAEASDSENMITCLREMIAERDEEIADLREKLAAQDELSIKLELAESDGALKERCLEQLVMELERSQKCVEQMKAALKPFSEDVQIFVENSVDGKTVVYNARPDDTVQMLKSAIEARTRIHIDTYYLFYGATQLDDERSISDYRIANESTVFLRLLQGAAPPGKNPFFDRLPTDLSLIHI